MPKDQSLHDFVVGDLMADIDGITARAMFGGWGIYQHGVFFALIAEGKLYFKVDGQTIGQYQERGCGPFIYRAPTGKVMTMAYYQLPEEIAEDHTALADWVDAAVAAAKRAKVGKPKRS